MIASVSSEALQYSRLLLDLLIHTARGPVMAVYECLFQRSLGQFLSHEASWADCSSTCMLTYREQDWTSEQSQQGFPDDAAEL